MKIRFKVLSAGVLALLCFEQLAWAKGEPMRVSLPHDQVWSRTWQTGAQDELIIHIQDAHSKLGAQQSIADTLDQLVKNYDLKFVALEGASGTVDTSLLSRFPDEKVRQRVSRTFLESGQISAGEFYSIVSGGKVELYGAEDSGLYQRDLAAFRELVEDAPQVRSEIRQLRKFLSEAENKIYSQELHRARQHRLPRTDASISFKDYWTYSREAMDRYDLRLDDYPFLGELDRLFALEQKLSFKQADQERMALFSELSQKLSVNELNKLFRDSLDYKRGRLAAAEFHDELIRTADRIQARTAIPHLLRYQEYLTRFDRLDLAGVLEDASRMEQGLLKGAAKTSAEKELVRLRLSFESITRCLMASLTGQEYAFLETSPKTLELDQWLTDLRALLVRSQISEAGLPLPQAMRKSLPKAKFFYELAAARDRSLLDNTLQKMRRDGSKIAALISGGFHSPGILRAAEAREVSCLVVMPKFDSQSSDRPYITVLTKKPKEFEEVFKDSEDFIAAQPLFSAQSAADGRRPVIAELFSSAYVALGSRYLVTGKRYLRELMRTRSLDPKTIADIAWLLRRQRDPSIEDPAIRREKGGVLLRFADGENILVQVRPAPKDPASEKQDELPLFAAPRVPLAMPQMEVSGARLASDAGISGSPKPWISMIKRMIAVTMAALMLASSIYYLRTDQLSRLDPSALLTMAPQAPAAVMTSPLPNAPAMADIKSSLSTSFDRDENLRKMAINYRRAATEADKEVAAYYFRAAERRASRELAWGEDNKTMIVSARAKAQQHMDQEQVADHVEAAVAEVFPTPDPVLVSEPSAPDVSLAPAHSVLNGAAAVSNSAAPEAIPQNLIPPSSSRAPAPWQPAQAQVTFYTDITRSKGFAPISFSTVDMWAKSGWIKAGVTFEGNYTGTSGLTVPKFYAEASLSSSGSIRVGVRKTVGDAREPVSVGVMGTFKVANNFLVSPEGWFSVSGAQSSPGYRAALVSTPITVGSLSVTPSFYKGEGANPDWQLTSSWDRGIHHIFASRNFKNALVMPTTHVTPDTGEFRLGYARDLSSIGLKIGGYVYKDADYGNGFGVIITKSAAFSKPAVSNTVTAGSATAGGGPPPPPSVIQPSVAPQIRLGVLLGPGYSGVQAQQLLAQTLGDDLARFRVTFLQDAESLIAQGSHVVVSADAIAEGDTKLMLLKTLAQVDRDSLDILLPFMSRFLTGRTDPLEEEEKRKLISVLESTFPDPAPRKVILTSRGAELAPELVPFGNGPQTIDEASRRIAAMIDTVLTEALVSRTEDARQKSRADLREVSQIVGRFLSRPETAPSGNPLLNKKLQSLLVNIPKHSGARLASVDPSHRIAVSAPGLSAALPKTIITDLDVFVKDGGGKAFALRMDRLDAQTRGLFRHVLWVRDERIRTLAQLRELYPEAQRFGTNVLFASGLAGIDELLRRSEHLPIERSIVILTSKPGLILKGVYPEETLDQVLVMSLDKRADSTIGMLENAALSLMAQIKKFHQMVYLPPVMPLDFSKWLADERIREAAQRSA